LNNSEDLAAEEKDAVRKDKGNTKAAAALQDSAGLGMESTAAGVLAGGAADG